MRATGSMNSGGDREPSPLARRGAALAALLVPVAMVALAAVALRGNLALALLAVALVLLASAAIWLALISRGARRVTAVAAALVCAGGLVALFATHWQGTLVLLALLVLLVLFGVCARYAMPRTGEPVAGELGATLVRSPAGGRSALIMNLKSGGGKAERFELASEARTRGIEPIILGPGDDLLELAEDAIVHGAQTIGMAGGDGSQALVATVAARRHVAYVCVPAGTRNHFALDLGLDRDDVLGALDAFTDGVERRVDLARVNDHVFVNNASLGVYAKVVQSEAYRDAKLETWTRMLPDLLGPEAPPIDLEFMTPEGERCDDAPLVLVSNNPYQLVHLAGAGTRARIDSGTLGVVAARVRSPGDVSKLVGLELVGQLSRFSGLISFTTPALEVHSHERVEVGLDGEALVLDPPLRFVSMPGALRVRLPAAAGIAPAARAVALSAESLGDLLRVAAGR